MMNCAYFIDTLRRKQALIEFKEHLKLTIEKRNIDVEEMKEQLRETAKIIEEVELIELH